MFHSATLFVLCKLSNNGDINYKLDCLAGRYCEWIHKTTDQAAVTDSFEEYTKTLNLSCSEGEPAVLNWTVAHETPDLVYYQVSWNNLAVTYPFKLPDETIGIHYAPITT